MNKLKLLINWIRATGSGLYKLPIDVRDFKLSKVIGGAEYRPKKVRLDLGCISVKDQKKFNNCVFQSVVAGKEIDEGVKLSVRSVVSYARRMGWISGNGFSNLRYGQMALKNFGAEEYMEGEEDVKDWEEYSNININFSKAEKHKIASFWSVDTVDEIYKMLDEGRWIHIGMDWYNGFNQSGGFKMPWLITQIIGFFVGGHATFIRGYDTSYQGRKVFKIQNSYSKLWGADGCFYVDVDYIVKDIKSYGAYVNLDIAVDTGKLINLYDGKNVKIEDNPTIWSIQQGKKKAYPTWETFLAYRGQINWYTEFKKDSSEAEALTKVVSGDDMDITKSYYYAFIMDDLKKSDDKNHSLWKKLTELYQKDKMGLLNN